jgi:predicted ATP-dependent serine protease
VPAPSASAFVGEIGLTGVVRPAPGMAARLSAAKAAGLRTVFVPEGTEPANALRLVPVRHVMQALTWAAARPGARTDDRPP